MIDDLSGLNEFQRRFAELASMEPQQRGNALPALLASAFERAGFRAQLQAGAAGPRDTDLFLSYDDEFLVEVKWTKHKAGIEEIGALRTRLSKTAPHVVGLLVSIGGFARTALDAAQTERSRLILLFDRADVEALFEGNDSIPALLRLKKRALVRDAVALVGRRTISEGHANGAEGLHESAEHLLDADGNPTRWLEIDGYPGDVVFVDQVPDIDWLPAQGHGVGLDLHLPVHSADDLSGVLRTLCRLGWISRQGRYAIQQPTYGWHGCGARELLEALQQRPERYRRLNRQWHDEEHFTYFDSGPGWFYTITGRVYTRPGILVDSQFSMQLTGVPVDTTRYRILLEALGLDERSYFRPLDGDRGPRTIPLHSDVSLTVRGQILERSLGGDWVKAILVDAPILSPEPPPDVDSYALKHAKHWICRLRGWHPASERDVSYSLSSFEQTWTDPAHIVSVTADWTSPAQESGPVITLEGFIRSPARARRPTRRGES